MKKRGRRTSKVEFMQEFIRKRGGGGAAE